MIHTHTAFAVCFFSLSFSSCVAASRSQRTRVAAAYTWANSEESPMSLNLEPNEFVGYRIRPDWYSFNVVLVKRHGPTSKHAGKEYDTPLAYCKTLKFAVEWLTSHAARMHGELGQREQFAATGSVADAAALIAAFECAQACALAAVDALQVQLDGLGLAQRELVQALRGEPVSNS